jgi:hypothetical protein
MDIVFYSVLLLCLFLPSLLPFEGINIDLVLVVQVSVSIATVNCFFAIGIYRSNQVLLLPRFLDFWLMKDRHQLILGYCWQVLSICHLEALTASAGWLFGHWVRKIFVSLILSIWTRRFSNWFQDFIGTTKETPKWPSVFLILLPRARCLWFVHW